MDDDPKHSAEMFTSFASVLKAAEPGRPIDPVENAIVLIAFSLHARGLGKLFKSSGIALITSEAEYECYLNDPFLGMFLREGVSLRPDLHQMQCDLAERLMQQRRRIPDWLLRYVVETARKGPPRKRSGPDNHLRNIAIVVAVETVCTWTGLPTSRNEATDGHSGCSIVSEALARIGVAISAKRIATIHGDLQRKHPLPPRLLELDE